MNFFESQDRARRNTFKLMALFAVAVIVIVIAVNLAVVILFAVTAEEIVIAPEIFVIASIATVLVIGGGSLYKTASLSGNGGAKVARMLGGRPVLPNTDDPDEIKLRNVVEEMAIASGVPVPAIYVMDGERGINAFAAGYSTEDAAIGVTRGCIELLNRDELQGVIAHEFSHILNGDMRLNIRLIGIIFGILVIAVIGQIALRSAAYSRSGMSSRGRRDSGAPVILFGLALIVIGYIGVFFGRLIQAAVSRQREYLADAAAVQFTRNPGGIAGALKKIGGFSRRAKIENAHAMEASHMFFGNAVGSAMTDWMATHPPLARRIRAIDPTFDGSFPRVRQEEAMAQRGPERLAGTAAQRGPERFAAMASLAGGTPASSAGAAATAAAPPPRRPVPAAEVDPDRIIEEVGRVSPEQVSYAAGLLQSLPGALLAAAHEPFGARAVVYCLLLDRDRDIRLRQLDHLRQHADPQVYQEALKMVQAISSLQAETRLPLLELAIPSLRELSPEQRDVFLSNVKALIEANQRVSLFEYALYTILRHHIGPSTGRRSGAIQYYALKPMIGDIAVLLSALARAGSAPEHAAANFSAGAARLDADGDVRFADVSWRDVDRALQRLAASSPAIKRRILDAAAHTVAADGRLHVEESELLRAIAVTLDCPLPPRL